MLHFYCLGDLDTCTGFRLAGVQAVTPESPADAAGIFAGLLQQEEIGILIITELIAVGLKEQIAGHRLSGKLPMIVEIPENFSGEFSGQSLMDSIKQAVGISI